MEITALIAQHITDVHEGNNWTGKDITSVLRDVTFTEATTQTAASVNTIAALLQHLTYWNRIMVQRIAGIKVAVPDTNGFDVPAPQNEKSWELMKDDNISSARDLADAIRNFDGAKLQDPILSGYSTAYKNLQGSVEHIHYHLGQMVILKNLLRSSTGK